MSFTVSPGGTKIVRIFVGFMTRAFKGKMLLSSQDLAVQNDFFQQSNSYLEYHFEIFNVRISFRL